MHNKGGAYKNETIHIPSLEGDGMIGHLDWSHVQQYDWNGQHYTDIPFVFDGYGTEIPGKDSSIAPASFNLVVRPNGSGGYEGALRTTMHSVYAENLKSGGHSLADIQSYTLMDGTEGNLWHIDLGSRKMYAATRQHLTDEQAAAMRNTQKYLSLSEPSGSGGGKGVLMTAPAPDMNCITSSYKVYYSYSYADAGSYGGDAVLIGSYTVYEVTCFETNSDGGGNTGGNTGGSTGGGSYPPAPTDESNPSSPKDPCAEAKSAAQKATNVASSNGYKDGLSKVNAAANTDSKEHSVALNEDANGNIISPTTVSNGGETNTSTPINDNTYATLHNHTNGSPPSVGDIYGLIKGNSQHSKFTTKFVTLGDNGPVYALVVTDPVAANEFINAYPPDNENSFPEGLNDEWSQIFFGTPPFASEEVATAYILDKYVQGVALLKQNSDGSFSRLGATKKDNGEGNNPTFSETKCNY
ncbi:MULTISPECIES: hypothetical protein [Chitinophagaceae]